MSDAAMNGVERIATERRRQIDREGWSPERDRELYPHAELVMAASAYAWAAQLAANTDCSEMTPADWQRFRPDYWPWDESWWKPSNDPIRNLEKAGALIAAEIDRLLARAGEEGA